MEVEFDIDSVNVSPEKKYECEFSPHSLFDWNMF